MTRIISVLAMLLIFVGCEDEASVPVPPTPSAPNTTAAPSQPAAAPIDSSQATGVWNQSQVEQWLRETLKLISLTLSKGNADNYTGQATNADGEKYELNVTQVPGGIACRFTFGTGGKGRIAFGNPVADSPQHD